MGRVLSQITRNIELLSYFQFACWTYRCVSCFQIFQILYCSLRFYFHLFFFAYFFILFFHGFHTWSHAFRKRVCLLWLFFEVIALVFIQGLFNEIFFIWSLNKNCTFLFQVFNFLTSFNEFLGFLIQSFIQWGLEILASFMIVFHFCCWIINERLFRVCSFITNWVILWKFIYNILITPCENF